MLFLFKHAISCRKITMISTSAMVSTVRHDINQTTQIKLLEKILSSGLSTEDCTQDIVLRHKIQHQCNQLFNIISQCY